MEGFEVTSFLENCSKNWDAEYGGFDAFNHAQAGFGGPETIVSRKRSLLLSLSLSLILRVVVMRAG